MTVEFGEVVANKDLESLGLTNLRAVYWNLHTPALYEESIRRSEGIISHLGPLVVRTGEHTGRSPNDKFFVKQGESQNHIWWGSDNKPMDPDNFEVLYKQMMSYIQGKDIFIQSLFVGKDEKYRLPVQVITEYAWHNLFARNLFIRPEAEELETYQPEFTIIDFPRFRARPEVHNTNSGVFIIVNLEKRLVIIGGTSYGGEIKKSAFTLMNYLLPGQGVFPMHCSANYGPKGDSAVFFGLSGTGKTTLSADSSRTLIGDDEHGWSENGVFNFEGGCYAKMIKLSQDAEPEIFETTRRFGTILENVAIDVVTRHVDLDDASLTENTRGAYPVTHIPNIDLNGIADVPKNVVFLTADAFGVLPPISKLTTEQAMYHFLSGYTAKLAGTEKGVTEPQATFSLGFGQPFLPLSPAVYANMLGDKIEKHDVNVWLINTGWSGGPYGVGSRMKIAYTRAIVNAALNGELDDVPTEEDTIFGLHIPTSCPDVPAEVLIPRNTWTDQKAYDETATKLAKMFQNNFKKYDDIVTDAVKAAGPKV